METPGRGYGLTRGLPVIVKSRSTFATAHTSLTWLAIASTRVSGISVSEAMTAIQENC
jgi:hypothetical protein